MVRKRNVRKHHTLGLQKKTTQTGNEWLVPLHHIGIALGVGSDILKSIIRDLYLSNTSFQGNKLVLIYLMIAPNFSLQYLRFAGLC